jgi:hypothetical protein
MSDSVALGSGPITLTAQDGRLLLIPLSALTFDTTGNIQANKWPLYNNYKADVDPWLGYLVSIGALTPGTTSPPTPAMIIQAADDGRAGNNINVDFHNIVTDPADPTNAAKTTFDATVTETDTYKGLSSDSTSPSFIGTVLGTEKKVKGTKPGLVHILDADIPSLSLPKAGVYQLTGGGASAKSSVKVSKDPTGTAFNVEAKKNGTDGDNTTVTISNVDATAKTFTLTAGWTQSVNGSKLADLPDSLQGSSKYEIIVNKPNGGNFAIPVPGTIGLSGGADPTDATKASGTVFAS